jgi:hypothetical protein
MMPPYQHICKSEVYVLVVTVICEYDSNIGVAPGASAALGPDRGARTQHRALAVEVGPEAKSGKRRARKLAWPEPLAERLKAVRTALVTVREPVTARELAKRFAPYASFAPLRG